MCYYYMLSKPSSYKRMKFAHNISSCIYEHTHNSTLRRMVVELIQCTHLHYVYVLSRLHTNLSNNLIGLASETFDANPAMVYDDSRLPSTGTVPYSVRCDNVMVF